MQKITVKRRERWEPSRQLWWVVWYCALAWFLLGAALAAALHAQEVTNRVAYSTSLSEEGIVQAVICDAETERCALVVFSTKLGLYNTHGGPMIAQPDGTVCLLADRHISNVPGAIDHTGRGVCWTIGNGYITMKGSGLVMLYDKELAQRTQGIPLWEES